MYFVGVAFWADVEVATIPTAITTTPMVINRKITPRAMIDLLLRLLWNPFISDEVSRRHLRAVRQQRNELLFEGVDVAAQCLGGASVDQSALGDDGDLAAQRPDFLDIVAAEARGHALRGGEAWPPSVLRDTVSPRG